MVRAPIVTSRLFVIDTTFCGARMTRNFSFCPGWCQFRLSRMFILGCLSSSFTSDWDTYSRVSTVYMYEEKKTRMSVAGRLGSRLVAALAQPEHVQSLRTSLSPKRSAVAVIVRRCPWQPEASQLLYILRATSQRDSWSGQVAFPGGRSQPTETDLAAAVRETREEVGLDLDDPASFTFAGQLAERPVTARGVLVPGLVLCPFVFVQHAAETPPLRLQGDEVAAVCWAHEDCLAPDYVVYSVERPYSPLPPAISAALPPALLRALGLASVRFPAIHLRERDPREKAAESSRFELWGITLGITSDLLKVAGCAPVAGPPRPLNALARMALALRLQLAPAQGHDRLRSSL